MNQTDLATTNGHKAKTTKTLEDLVREHDDAKATVAKARKAEGAAAAALAKLTGAYNAAHLAHQQAEDKLTNAQRAEDTALKARREAERRVA